MQMHPTAPRRAHRFLRSRSFVLTVTVGALGAAAIGITLSAADPGAAPASERSTSAPSVAPTTAGSVTTHRPATSTTARRTSTTLAVPPTTAKQSSSTHQSGSAAHNVAPPPNSAPSATAPPAAPAPPVLQQQGGVQSFCNGWITRKPPGHGMIVDDSTGGRMPTAADCANAHAFFNAVVAANSKYADINVAIAAGFRSGGDPPSQTSQHYVQWGPSPGIADPNHPEGLVYRFDASGHATLLGVMFVEKSNNLPQPGGPITVWHHHTTGNAGHMLHVWMFPGAHDPFALMYTSAW